MNNQLQLLTAVMCALLLTSASVTAGQQGAETGKQMLDGSKARIETEQQKAPISSSAELERKRIEKEMQERTQQESAPGESSIIREQKRATEEMHKQTDNVPAQQTTRKWWEFWK